MPQSNPPNLVSRIVFWLLGAAPFCQYRDSSELPAHQVLHWRAGSLDRGVARRGDPGAHVGLVVPFAAGIRTRIRRIGDIRHILDS